MLIVDICTRTFADLNANDDVRSIGRPLPTVQMAILDQFGDLAPLYVQGEICLGGPQLFRGYQGRQDLTDAAHVIHKRYGRLYKTGDLGFLDRRGNIIFCGRRDHQVKFNGHRIELNDLSTIIEGSSYVEKAIVTMLKDRLVAFLLNRSRREPKDPTGACDILHDLGKEELDAIQKHTRAHLPSAIVPTMWLQISHVPITNTGKVDMRKLAECLNAVKQDDDCNASTAPEDEWELTVYDCCRDVLGVSVSMTDSLFDQGLNSYSAMALIGKLRMAFPSFQLSLRGLLENPIPRSFALLARDGGSSVEHANAAHSSPAVTILARPGSSSYYPSSSIQKRFFLAQEVFQDATYNIPVLFEMTHVDTDSVRKGLNSIVTENAIFHTFFDYTPKGELWQVVKGREMRLDVPEHDFSSYGRSAAWSQVREVLQTDVDEPFNVKVFPLLRCIMFKMSQNSILLYVNMHHSITDEKSLELFMAELSAKAAAHDTSWSKAKGIASNAAQYVDYCVEERQRLADVSTVDGALSFWKRYLRDMSAMVLPISQAQELPKPSLRRHSHLFSVPSHTFRWAHTAGVTDFSIYLTFFQILLMRRWGDSEPSFLVPISQRPTGWREPLYGCFLNTVPIRGHVIASSTLESSMLGTSRNLLDVMDRSFIPYESILQCAGLKPNDLQAMYVYHEETSARSIDHIDHSYVLRGLSVQTKPKFALTFSLTLSHDGQHHVLSLAADYDASRVSGDVVQSLCEHYQTLIRSSAEAGPTAVVGSINILKETERGLLQKLREQQIWPHHELVPVHESIGRRAHKTPEHIACCVETSSTVTYRELWALVKCVSEQLLHYYFRKDDRLALFMEPGEERIASLVATLRAGFAYVPLDVKWPARRTAAIIESCTPQAVLVSSKGGSAYNLALEGVLAELAKAGTAVRLHYVGDRHAVDHPSGPAAPKKMPVIGASDLAYVLYTSGSTGAPKGVQIQHGALDNALREHCRIYQLRSSSRLLQLAPWTFDVSVVDILGTLLTGATLCIGAQDHLLSRLEEAVNLMGVTHIATTPTIAGLLRPEKAPSLEVLAIGGEPMTRAVQQTWCTAVRLLNVYGPTEATVNVVSCHVQPETAVGVIGKPLKNCAVYVLNDQLQEVPWGSVGNLAIGGLQLARGYVDTDMDKGAFVSHPTFGRIFLSGMIVCSLPLMYPTNSSFSGDLARFMEDGNIQCLGRCNNRVKLRGQRIELEEIEYIISSHSRMHLAVALLVQKESFQALCATFSTKTPAKLRNPSSVVRPYEEPSELVAQLHELAKGFLPSYAVPSYWVPLSSVPIDRNGKINRQRVRDVISALSLEELGKFTFEEKTDKPGTPLEAEKEKIIGMCIREVLSVGEVYKSSNFFALSGDSISAIRLCALANYHGIRFSHQ